MGHNLVNGAYPMTGDGRGFTGGAFDFADLGGAHIEGHHNVAVNHTNNGFTIATVNSAAEQAAIDQFEQSAIANGVTIGPPPLASSSSTTRRRPARPRRPDTITARPTPLAGAERVGAVRRGSMRREPLEVAAA